ncbi:MAG: BatA and WFA domain-containing protein [Endomicrobiia bacterium]|nr:BatA and WFA domain-containing protein [Endomicrobiia bacterium]
MSIFFAAPSRLIFLISALAPPLVHLLSKRQKTIVLPSVLLLRKIRREKTLLRRWQKILLMILRSAALAALAASFAKPYISFASLERMSGAAAASGDSAVIFLFDSSMSRTFAPTGTVEHEAAKTAALDILSKLPKETSVAVMSYSDAPEAAHTPFTLNKVAAAEGISRITSGYKGTDHASGIEAAARLLQESRHSKKTVIWFTDAARTGFDRQTSLSEGTLLIVAAPEGSRPNASVTGYVQSLNNTLTARINSYGFEGPALLSLSGGANQSAQMNVILKNGQNSAPTFWKPEGGETLGLEIRGDGLRRDDIFRFAAPEAKLAGKILIVDGNPRPGHLSEIYYVEAAARASRLLDVKTVRFYDFGTIRPKDFDSLIFSNFWPDKRADEIASYVAAGGRVVVFAGDNFQEGMKLNGITLGSLISTRETARKTDDLLKFVPGAEALDWNSSVTKYFEISAQKDFTALLRLDDGAPFIFTDGGFTFVNSAADRSRSDFPVKPGFAPLLNRFISPKETGRESVVYGFVGKPARAGERPDANARLVVGDKRIPIVGGVIPPVDEPGIYTIEYIKGSQRIRSARFIVNTPPEESDTRPAEDLGEFIKNAAIYRVSPTETRRIASMASGLGGAGILRLIFLALFAAENIVIAAMALNKK